MLYCGVEYFDTFIQLYHSIFIKIEGLIFIEVNSPYFTRPKIKMAVNMAKKYFKMKWYSNR